MCVDTLSADWLSSACAIAFLHLSVNDACTTNRHVATAFECNLLSAKQASHQRRLQVSPCTFAVPAIWSFSARISVSVHPASRADSIGEHVVSELCMIAREQKKERRRKALKHSFVQLPICVTKWLLLPRRYLHHRASPVFKTPNSLCREASGGGPASGPTATDMLCDAAATPAAAAAGASSSATGGAPRAACA